MSAIRDLTGQIFNRLSVIERAGSNHKGNSLWRCLCVCGKTATALGYDLRLGKVQSCGCLNRENARVAVSQMHKRGRDNNNFKHGHSPRTGQSLTYYSWSAMIQRITNPKRSFYRLYGGAGVKVCDRWLNFDNFLSDMGERQEGTTLGRFGDIGNYEPGNCAWQTPRQQHEEQRKKRSSAKQVYAVAE